jgi:hypothetical protein
MTAPFLLLRPDQGGTHADRAHQVGRDGVDQKLVVDTRGGFVGQHDAGVVEEDVESGIVVHELGGRTIDAGWVGDVQLDRRHPRICGDDRIEVAAPAAGNDHLVAQLVKSLGQPTADTGAAAGDEDGVACEFHDSSPRARSDAGRSVGEPVTEHRQSAE